mmetsp:Transcript_34526/g.47187  ORF Transcript_34526/g.47187 Transcript_34526/m.47187 type:complete len:336 (+) Transcript_34526:232-1239(+)
MNQRYRTCLPTRKKEQEILQKKRQKIPYVLEDGNGKHCFTGTRHGDDQGSYVMFLLNANDAFSVIPLKDWYTFTPKIQRKKLSLEEAEAEQSKREEKLAKAYKQVDDSDEPESSSYQGVFSRGKKRGGEDAEDGFDDGEAVAVEEYEEMSDDEDVLGIGHIEDRQDMEDLLKNMNDETSDSDEYPESESAPSKETEASNEEENPEKPELPASDEGGDQATEAEGSDETRKRNSEMSLDEPARKKMKTEVGSALPEDADRLWERKAEETVKRILSRRPLPSAKLLKKARKQLGGGLSDKKKKGKFFKVVKKLAVVKELQSGERVLSLKPQFMTTVS